MYRRISIVRILKREVIFMNKEKRTIISIIMTVIIIWLVIITIVTGRENTKQKVELEETKQNLEEAKQELAECKADELEINPCPFCGSQDVELKEGIGWYVRCKDCDGIGPCHSPNDIWDENTKTEAIEMWNASYKGDNRNEK
jgi:hypothetical protein